MTGLLPPGANIWPGMVQQSEQWFKARAGRPTASQFSRIITAARGEPSAGWRDYVHELLGQRNAPYEVPKFAGSHWTDRGNELEGEARAMFCRDMGVGVDQVGFVTNDRWGNVAGSSPDGLILSPDGTRYAAGLEIKALMAKNHVAIWDYGRMPDDYKQQVHGAMAVHGLPCWWFMSYHPAMRPFYQKIEWDAYTDKVAAALDVFILRYGELSDKLGPVLRPLETEDLL